ncbi:MAG: anti-sigma factor [Gemmatimonadaceae bacterium]
MTTRDQMDSAAAYALGAVDPDERAALDALMEQSPEFRLEVERYRHLVGLMAYAARVVPAPETLRQRILSDARAVRPIASAAPKRPARPFSAALPWLAAAAGLGFAIVTSNRLRASQDAAAALRSELVTAQQQLAIRDSTMAAFMGPEVHVVSLSEADRKPSARVFWNHTKNVFIVTAFNVPPAPVGKTYQLWAISKGKNPMSMGTFNTDATGRATLIVPVGNTITTGGFIDLCGMTLEPEGGSPQPTEAPRLVGTWRHTD